MITFDGPYNGPGEPDPNKSNIEMTLLQPMQNIDCSIPDYPKNYFPSIIVKTRIGIIHCGEECRKFECLDGSPYNRCYRLSSENEWVPFQTMNQFRGTQTSMIEMDGKLFAVGGSGDSRGDNLMEWTSLENGVVWTTEEMPFRVRGHCVTKFNETHLLLTGGTIDETSSAFSDVVSSLMLILYILS